MGRPKQSIEDKVQKKFPDFALEVAKLSVADLEKRLSNNAKAVNDWEQRKEEDQELNDLKEEVSERNAVYSDPIKELKLKSRYLTALIKEKGGQ